MTPELKDQLALTRWGGGWQVVRTTCPAQLSPEPGAPGSKVWRSRGGEGGEEAQYSRPSRSLPVSAVLQGPQWREP